MENKTLTKEQYQEYMDLLNSNPYGIKNQSKLTKSLKNFGGRLAEAGRLLKEESGTKEKVDATRTKLALFIAPKQ